MADNFDACDAFVEKEEGGYSVDPTPTNHGITQATLSTWMGRQATEDDVRNLSVETAQKIRRALYWALARCDLLNPGVDVMVYNAAINMGPHASEVELARAEGVDLAASAAISALQQALGVYVDGHAGPQTLGAQAATFSPSVLVANLRNTISTYYKTLGNFPTYGAQWLARLDRCFDLAMSMVKAQEVPVAVAQAPVVAALSNASPIIPVPPVNSAPPAAIPAPIFVPPTVAVQEAPPVAQMTIQAATAPRIYAEVSSAWAFILRHKLSIGAAASGIFSAISETYGSNHMVSVACGIVAFILTNFGISESPQSKAVQQFTLDGLAAASKKNSDAIPGLLKDAEAVDGAFRG